MHLKITVLPLSILKISGPTLTLPVLVSGIYIGNIRYNTKPVTLQKNILPLLTIEIVAVYM